MRAIFATCFSLVICLALFGCDQSPGQSHASTPVPVAAATTPCNCNPAKTSLTVSKESHHRHYHSRGESAPNSKTASNSKKRTYSKGNTSPVREYGSSDEKQDAGDVMAEEQAVQTATTSGNVRLDGHGSRALTTSKPTVTIDHHPNQGDSWGGSASYFEGPSNLGSSSYSERTTPSAREYGPDDEDQDAGDVMAEERSARTITTAAGVWIDGYGQPHYPDFGPLGDEHPGLISPKYERVRAEAWHGYDSNCDAWIN